MDYLVDHSIYFYLMGGFSGRRVFQFPFPSSPNPEDFQASVHLSQRLTRHPFFPCADPDGDFIEAIGRQHSAEKASRIIKEHMSDWKDGKKLS